MSTWENVRSGTARCVTTERPLTRSLDLREEGLAVKATRVCSVDGCDRPLLCCGMCNMHYLRKQKHGSPYTVLPSGGPRPGGGRKRTSGAIGYVASHARIYIDRGRADVYNCAHCGEPAVDWAYDHTDPDERIDSNVRPSTAYSIDPARYLPLCRPCHIRFDRGR